MNNTKKLREEVNPVFTTARVCLRINALMGDSDAQKLTKLLGFEDNLPASDTDDEMPQEMKEFVLHTMNRGFSIMVESRFASSSNLILKSGIKNVMDMPCGYTPRGVKFSRSGLRYFGLDLPAVIDAIGPASKEVIGNNDNIVYQAVDATSYTSLRKALSGVNGELFITTEPQTAFGVRRKMGDHRQPDGGCPRPYSDCLGRYHKTNDTAERPPG